MKNIAIEVKQIGNDFIVDSNVTIKVDGKKIDNDVIEIIKEATEIKPFIWDYCGYNYGNGLLNLKAPNGRLLEWTWNGAKKLDANYLNEDKIKNFMDEVVQAIKEIEEFVKTNNSQEKVIKINY